MLTSKTLISLLLEALKFKRFYPNLNIKFENNRYVCEVTQNNGKNICFSGVTLNEALLKLSQDFLDREERTATPVDSLRDYVLQLKPQYDV